MSQAKNEIMINNLFLMGYMKKNSVLNTEFSESDLQQS